MLISNKYKFYPKVVLRTPRNPIYYDLDLATIKSKFQEPHFQEAVFIASPHLYEAGIKWLNNYPFEPKVLKKIILSLAKYLLREATRPTPFGLFSGVATVNWGETTSIKITENNKRHTRLDMNYLCALAQKIALNSTVKTRLKYSANSSIYRINNEIRYVEYSYYEGKRIHQITAVKQNKYINRILNLVLKSESTFSEMVSCIQNKDINEGEAKDFISQLIDIQILTSQLEPCISGKEYIFQIVAILNEINFDKDRNLSLIIKDLNSIIFKLDQIDLQNLNNLNLYNQIIKIINKYKIQFDQSYLFQTDLLIQPIENSCLSELHQNKIIELIDFLQNIELAPNSVAISKFKQKFYERYQDQELPLLHVLDTESGIGYLNKYNGDYTPLIEGIDFSNGNNKDSGFNRFNTNQKILFEALVETNSNKVIEINLEQLNFTKSNKETVPLPPSFNVLMRLFENDTIFVESIGGTSAASLLGRFAHADPEIERMVLNIVELEQNTNQDVIFAEIIHLPENRTGNILLHPTFREYEIPYLSRASVAIGKQLKLSDLYVSVKNDKIVLKSIKHNKIVIPRLSNAHNFSDDALPIYQFLCDLQGQNTQQFLNFQWGQLSDGFRYLPRVNYKGIILSLATWLFSKKDYENIHTFIEFQKFKLAYNIPELFYIADGDNELIIDASNELLIDIFLETIKNKDSIVLKEYINYSKLIGNNSPNSLIYANQFIVPIINSEKNYYGKKEILIENSNQRNFIFGSEWVYYKLYCGAKASDTILQYGIANCLKNAQKLKMLKTWFFIRYEDPEPHLRVRFQLKDVSQLQEFIVIFNKAIEAYINNGSIWKIQLETYERELERYGFETIEYNEAIFCANSNLFLKLLSITEGEEREDLRWKLALKVADETMDRFKLTLLEKLDLMERSKNSFSKEFGIAKHQKITIDLKYREHYEEIQDLLKTNSMFFNKPLIEYNKQLTKINYHILACIQKRNHLYEMILSQLHMNINRFISSNQRQHELLIYDFLYKFYKSKIARQTTLF